MDKKNLSDLITEIKEICKQHPLLEERLLTLKQTGFGSVSHQYVNKGGRNSLPSYANRLFEVNHLPRKRVYRIQISNTEVKKGFPSAWCIDIPSENVIYEPELPVEPQTNVSVEGHDKNNSDEEYF